MNDEFKRFQIESQDAAGNLYREIVGSDTAGNAINWFESISGDTVTRCTEIPDSPEISPFDEMAAYQSGRGVHS